MSPQRIHEDVRRAMLFAAALVNDGMGARAAAVEAVRITGVKRHPDSLVTNMRRHGLIGIRQGMSNRAIGYPDGALEDWITLREARVRPSQAAKLLKHKYKLEQTVESIWNFMNEKAGTNFRHQHAWTIPVPERAAQGRANKTDKEDHDALPDRLHAGPDDRLQLPARCPECGCHLGGDPAQHDRQRTARPA